MATIGKDLEQAQRVVTVAQRVVAELKAKAVDGAIAAATELGYLDALRARLTGDEEPRPERKPAVPVVKRKAKAKRSAPGSAKKGGGEKGARGWRAMPGFEAWARKIIAPVLALPTARGGGRQAAVEAIVGARHRLPDGTSGRVGKTQVYSWMREFGGSRTRAPKKPAASDTEDEPVRIPRSLQTVYGGTGPKARRRAELDAQQTVEAELLELQRAGKVGLPLQVARGYEGPVARKQDCPALGDCLTYAARQKWQAMTCGGCHGPGIQPGQKIADTNRIRRQETA